MRRKAKYYLSTPKYFQQSGEGNCVSETKYEQLKVFCFFVQLSLILHLNMLKVHCVYVIAIDL